MNKVRLTNSDKKNWNMESAEKGWIAEMGDWRDKVHYGALESNLIS